MNYRDLVLRDARILRAYRASPVALRMAFDAFMEERYKPNPESDATLLRYVGALQSYIDFPPNKSDAFNCFPSREELESRKVRAGFEWRPNPVPGAPPIPVGIVDWLAPSGTTYAKEYLESTNVYLDRIDGDAKKAIKDKKILANTKDSLGYRWSKFYGEWLAYYGKVQEDGINSLNAENVTANSKKYRETGDEYAKELKGKGVDVSPPPMTPAEPPPLIGSPELVGSVIGVVAGAAAVLGIITVLSKTGK